MEQQKRKPGRPKGEPSIPVSIRLTEKQHAAFIERGGARWIKRMIDEAMVTKEIVDGFAGLGA